jgi:hypothetical protein
MDPLKPTCPDVLRDSLGFDRVSNDEIVILACKDLRDFMGVGRIALDRFERPYSALSSLPYFQLR